MSQKRVLIIEVSLAERVVIGSASIDVLMKLCELFAVLGLS